MKAIPSVLIMMLLVWAAAAAPATPRKPAPAARKTTSFTPKSVPKRSYSSTSRKTAAAKSKAPISRKAARPTPRYYGQSEPAPERYREIQQALVERGYLRTDPNGRWDADSADALARFQRNQNLESNGKLDSLSLIALGLGPKRTVTAQTRPQ
ncbi:MAG TPA: peptidoglycan-binding domain-containing protein [Bryobacteraceae bacterium]|nr:peptidoglycan-binding domain-containing protein [Bryobacteraceae bacterium]